MQTRVLLNLWVTYVMITTIFWNSFIDYPYLNEHTRARARVFVCVCVCMCVCEMDN